MAPTAKQFMHEKPLVPPLHSLFLPPLFLLGIGLLFTHTQVFKTLEHTSMLITSHELLFWEETCTFDWCFYGVLPRKSNRELNEVAPSMERWYAL